MWYLFLWAVMVWEQISSPLPYHVIITSPYCPVSFLALPAYLGQTIATSIPPFPFPFLSFILYKPQKGSIDPAGLLSHNASVNAFAQGHRDDSWQEKELRIWQNSSPFFFHSKHIVQWHMLNPSPSLMQEYQCDFLQVLSYQVLPWVYFLVT